MWTSEVSSAGRALIWTSFVEILYSTRSWMGQEARVWKRN